MNRDLALGLGLLMGGSGGALRTGGAARSGSPSHEDRRACDGPELAPEARYGEAAAVAAPYHSSEAVANSEPAPVAGSIFTRLPSGLKP
jgi:hypothetical protein